MSQIYEEGNVAVHIPSGSKEPAAHCYDKRDESFRTVVVIDLLTFLPLHYGDDSEEGKLPSWKFAVEAIQVCAEHEAELWKAWENLKDEPFF